MMPDSRPHVDRRPELGSVVQPSLLGSFSRSQVASFAATVADYGVLFALTEVFGVWYVVSTALGALAGAVTNFLLNRHWSFKVAHVGVQGQARKYALVSAGSLALNTGGVWALTESTGKPYGYSVIAVSIAVGAIFNFPLQRWWVFRE